jgi:hypothetical protein
VLDTKRGKCRVGRSSILPESHGRDIPPRRPAEARPVGEANPSRRCLICIPHIRLHGSQTCGTAPSGTTMPRPACRNCSIGKRLTSAARQTNLGSISCYNASDGKIISRSVRRDDNMNPLARSECKSGDQDQQTRHGSHKTLFATLHA